MNKSKKHIAIFGIKFFPSRGGTSRVVESLLYYLKEEYTITIYCYQHPQANTNIPGIQTVMFPEPKIKNFGVFFYFIKCFFHLFFKGNFDLVHVHKTETSYFIPFIRLKYRVIATSHEIPYKNNKWNWFGKLYFHIAEWIFMHSGATLTSISKTQCEYYDSKYHKPVLYIPNGIEIPKISSDRSLNDFLQKNQIGNEFILFAARRIIPIKGCHHLIESLNQMHYQGQLVIAGDTDQMKEYTTELRNKGKNLNLIFVGYIGSSQLLNSVIKRSQLFVFPSEIEGMSMMLLEVACMGTPILCSDIPQNKVIMAEDHVLYFKSKDPVDLQKKLTWALDNPDKMAVKAETARKFTLKNYGIEKVASKYIDLYNSHLTPNTSHEFTQL